MTRKYAGAKVTDEQWEEMKEDDVFDRMYVKAPKKVIISELHFLDNGELDDEWVNDIYRTFDPKLLDPVRVGVLPNGDQYLYDGYHRMHALMKGNQKKVLAYIQAVNEIKDLYELHLVYNGCRKVKTPLDFFRIKVLAERKEAIAVKELMDRHELQFTRKQMERGIEAVRTVERVATNPELGLGILEQAFIIILGTYQGETGSFHGDIIEGLSNFLHDIRIQTSNFDNEQFIRKLSKTPKDVLIDRLTHRPKGIGEAKWWVKKITEIHKYGKFV